jgi:hypothetical protein
MWRRIVTLACAWTLAACSGVEVVELGKGEGFDFNTLQKVTGVKAYDPTTDSGRLVYPSETGCPDSSGAAMQGTVFCGNLYYERGPQCGTFVEADSYFDGTSESTVAVHGEMSWAIRGSKDIHWAVKVAGSNSTDATVVWLAKYDAAKDVAMFEYYTPPPPKSAGGGNRSWLNGW